MENLALTLSQDEALVLYDWLSSLGQSDGGTICDDVTQSVVWKMEGQLEKMIPDILMADYRERVVAAKSRL